jgi:hypothetical protein
MSRIDNLNLARYTQNVKNYVDGATDAIEDKIKITGTVTKAIGGIAKDKEYTNADIADVLSDLLFPYVAFTFNSIGTSAMAGTKEYGTSVTVIKVTPSFTTGSKAADDLDLSYYQPITFQLQDKTITF